MQRLHSGLPSLDGSVAWGSFRCPVALAALHCPQTTLPVLATLLAPAAGTQSSHSAEVWCPSHTLPSTYRHTGREFSFCPSPKGTACSKDWQAHCPRSLVQLPALSPVSSPTHLVPATIMKGWDSAPQSPLLAPSASGPWTHPTSTFALLVLGFFLSVNLSSHSTAKP